MKLLIIGYERSGKDTLAEILLKRFGLKYQSSSMAAAKLFIYDLLKDKYNYKTLDECFEDRVNHRKEWHDLICDYNKDDKARLAKEILKDNDVYVGMRSRDEIAECEKQGLFDLVIWVERDGCFESEESCGVSKEDADISIYNNSFLYEFEASAGSFFSELFSEIKIT